MAFVFAAVLLSPAAAPAEPETPAFAALRAILPAQPDNKICFASAYDAAHLRDHPRQRISAMKFLLRVGAYDPKPANAKQPNEMYYYKFAMSITRRGEKGLLRTAGDCMTVDGIACVVDCDGGGLTLDQTPPAGALIVRLDEDGIVMYHDCDENNDAVLVKPGADDKVFRLEKTATEACRALNDYYFK